MYHIVLSFNVYFNTKGVQSLTVVRLHVKITADVLAFCSCGWGISVIAVLFLFQWWLLYCIFIAN